MTSSDWLWKGIFFWFCVVYHLHLASVDGHHYTCVTLNGYDGLCVARRYCRQAVNQFLKPCEGDDTVCCPIQPSHRSAQRPAGTTAAPTTKTPIRPDRPKQEPPYDRNPPRTTYDDQRPSGRPSAESSKPKRDGPPVRQPPGSTHGISKDPVAAPVDEPLVEFEYESKYYEARPAKEVVRDRPSDYRPNDRNRPQPIPGPREESPSVTRTSGSDPKRQREDENVRGSNPRPQSVRPSHPNNDDIDPPRRHKPPDERPQPLPQVPACGVKPYDLFIAGGEISDEHEWPWMASIFRRHMGSKPKTFQCGGSLINTRYVLTAAHCFVVNNVILPASAYVVRLGSHSLSSGDEYAVSNLVLHYNHSGMENFNDIALVRLSSEVYVSDKIAPICLPLQDMMHENFVGRMAVVAGWGDTFFRSDGTRVLKHVSVPVVSNEECAAAYRRVRGAVFLAKGSNHVMCAGLMEGGKDACQGDSGGPLMLKSQGDRWSVVGIVSLGYKCAEPGYPGVYTRVTHYISWIQANMKPY